MSATTRGTPRRRSRRPSRLRTVKNNLATVLVTRCVRGRADPAGVGAVDGAQQGLARDHPQRLVHAEPARHHLHATRAAARCTPSSAPLEQVALCTIISVPIALLVGDLPGRVRPRAVAPAATTFMVDILTGIPSIVAALFIYALFVTTLRRSAGGWLVSLALVMLMIPVIVRTTEEMLKLVPNELREASYALGRAEVEDDREDRAADRVHRHPHRHRARHRPGGRRDRAAADPGRLLRRHRTATCSTAPRARCRADQRPVRQPRKHARARATGKAVTHPQLRRRTGCGAPPSP